MREPGGTDLIDRADEPEFEYRRRGPGARIRRAREMRRQRRRRQRRMVMLAWIAVVGLVVGADQLRRTTERRTTEAGRKPPAPSQESWLLIGTVGSDSSGQADWLSVLSHDPSAKQGLVMYLPRSTYVELPGYGAETVGRALALGREPLQIAAVSNLLGVQFDRHLRISDQGMRALFDKVGGLTVEVGSPLQRRGEAGRVATVFPSGRQHLDGAGVAELLGFIDASGDEISRGVRHATVWSALFERFRGEGGGRALGELFASSGDLFTSNAGAQDLRRFFGSFALLPATEVVFETLPVRSTGVDTGSQTYAPDREAIERLVDRYLAGSRPRGAAATGRRIEILNGNGSPGIGQRVAEQLVPKGFRLVLSQNAKRFDYEVTQIVVYSGSKAALDVGEDIRRTLGVGEIVVSRQQQSIVDVTIVVGRDYLEKHGG